MTVKAYELRNQTKAQLTEQLKDLKEELQTLKVQKVTGGNAPKMAKMYYSLTVVVKSVNPLPEY